MEAEVVEAGAGDAGGAGGEAGGGGEGVAEEREDVAAPKEAGDLADGVVAVGPGGEEEVLALGRDGEEDEAAGLVVEVGEFGEGAGEEEGGAGLSAGVVEGVAAEGEDLLGEFAGLEGAGDGEA